MSIPHDHTSRTPEYTTNSANVASHAPDAGNWRITGDTHGTTTAAQDAPEAIATAYDCALPTLEEQLDLLLAEESITHWSTPAVLDLVANFYPIPAQWLRITAYYQRHGGAVFQLERAVQRVRTRDESARNTNTPLKASCWSYAQTAEEFLTHEDVEVQADARDLVVPGCITIVAAPRASGKSLVALYLAVALAQGGVFRGERVPQRRVLLVDRDNPPALIRKRLRWLGAHKVTGLKVLTRDQAPPLTDAAAWATFPVDQYDVVIVDSIGAATEGVSEKEGKQTQQYLATLKDLTRRGPAVLALDNTNKAAQNYRGRGEKADAVDILYEARNITGWTPTHAGDWWEDLPDFGEHTWQQRATRRKGQAVLHIGFIPSKYRLGVEPDPFVLAIDTTEDPWTLDDITEDIAQAGQRAAEETSRQERAKVQAAQDALIRALIERSPEHPMHKCEAETFLCAQGLRQKVARTLLMQGGNHDVFPEGRWVLQAIPEARGNPIGVYLVREEDRNEKKSNTNPPCENVGSPPLIFVAGSTPSNEKTTLSIPRKSAGMQEGVFSSPRGCEATKIDMTLDKQPCGSPEGGIISVADAQSSAIPEEPCIHEHVHETGFCNDCGVEIESRRRDC
jgi:hypothetical protein